MGGFVTWLILLVAVDGEKIIDVGGLRVRLKADTTSGCSA
jgi:hypothetical protein